MILDVDPDSIRDSVGAQGDFGEKVREFKGVLQQVAHRGEQHFPVDIERKLRVNITDRESTFARLCLEGGRYFNIGNEIGERYQLVSRRHSRCYSHIGEGAIYETAHPNQGTVQYGPRCAGYPDVACLDGGDGKSR